MSRRTLDAIFKRCEVAGDAFAAGRGQLESELVRSLYEQAMDPKNRNPTPAIFLLKAMAGFIDHPQPQPQESRVEIKFALPGPLQPAQYKQLIEATPKKVLREATVDADG